MKKKNKQSLVKKIFTLILPKKETFIFDFKIKKIDDCCNICGKKNKEFIIYTKNKNKLLNVCQSCVSKQFRGFNKNI